MEEEVQQVLDSIEALSVTGDAATRARRLTQLLKELPELQSQMRQARQDAVIEMNQGGLSLRAIAAEVGLSFGRVRDIIEGVTSRKTQKRSAPDE